ncbi:trafficking protein particle complex subunit 4-like [Eurytemora carolleeae]|uniref:trafficking protein particle complex subunit 4-like n=1 Tax=Eurytemora carolleeae TaxID=1294199 RepID=UPI000C7802F7|nr:trafficking protein particle complex subunit 4-like [Eurytemora carolleeae]|eukprot:XP_023330535.1 trafficking protein particle complex subunit 4-like [Eurytemora affinis]
MGIYHIFIVSKSGGLIFNYDHNIPQLENEKTYSYPLDIKLKFENKRVTVAFGERDGICMGHVLMTVNGQALNYDKLPDGTGILEFLENKDNFPVNLKFGRAKITTNEKIVLASMFYPLYALAVQLSPEQGSSGILELESDTFKLHCTQTLTGIKFIIVADLKQAGIDQLMDKVYELYADFALKNPFYSLEMPIRADLFEQNLQVAIDQIEKTGFI